MRTVNVWVALVVMWLAVAQTRTANTERIKHKGDGNVPVVMTESAVCLASECATFSPAIRRAAFPAAGFNLTILRDSAATPVIVKTWITDDVGNDATAWESIEGQALGCEGDLCSLNYGTDPGVFGVEVVGGTVLELVVY